MANDISEELEQSYKTIDKNTTEFNRMVEEHAESFKSNMKAFYTFTGLKNVAFWLSIIFGIATFTVLLISVIKGNPIKLF